MCDCEPTRRDAIGLLAVAGAAILLGQSAGGSPTADAAVPTVPAVEVLPGLSIFPRDAWGADLPPKVPTQRETVKFLLVHHTASPNNYKSARDLIRATYAFQTGPSKKWRDVCYEFFIGRDGDVWEGRAGALAGPVVADATGGSQGFAQLVCLLGDFTSVQPTAAAQASLVKVLAWLGDRYQIDTAPGATTTFVSRGSQRWAAGTTVTAPTIAPHRSMSYTACPGDAFSPHVAGLAALVQTQRAAWQGVTKPAVRLGPAASAGAPG